MFKKLSIALVFALLLTGAAMGATTWTVANQSTVAWDVVTQLEDGTPIPAGDAITYRIHLKKEGAAGDGTQIAETEALEYTITFVAEGRWLAGIQAVRKPQANPEDIQKSIIVWSDSADTALVPVPFGFIYYLTPKAPAGIGPK